MSKKPKTKRKRLVLGKDFDGWAAWNDEKNDWERHSDLIHGEWKYYCPMIMRTKRQWHGMEATQHETLKICRVKIVEVECNE